MRAKVTKLETLPGCRGCEKSCPWGSGAVSPYSRNGRWGKYPCNSSKGLVEERGEKRGRINGEFSTVSVFVDDRGRLVIETYPIEEDVPAL